LFYSVLSWLPSIYRDHGYSPAETGLVLSAVTFVQIPVSLLVPRFAARARDQRRYIILSTTLTAVGLAGVLVAPTTMPYLWAMIIGVGLGGSFAIGLLLFVLRGRTASDTAQLSAMAQTFGYLLAATGPLLLGAVHDTTGSWSPPLALLVVFVVPQFVAGVLAGRPLQIGRSD
jgi:CP family cyanate transporter-like MFS transporter